MRRAFHSVRAAAVAGLWSILPAQAALITFEDLGLPPSTNYPTTGGFTSGGATFANSYTDWGTFISWNGFAPSTMTDTTTPGYTNQFSCIAGGSATYAVGFDDGFTAGPDMVITFPSDALVSSLWVNNTTYAYLSMRDGDSFAKKFGGADGTDPDWFRLRLEAFNADNISLGTNDFYLADFRSPNPADDYILAEWTPVDLTSFGATVRTLVLTLDSSDVGPWGMNTPAYVAVDNITYTIIPEPATAGLMIAGGVAVWARRRRGRSQDDAS